MIERGHEGGQVIDIYRERSYLVAFFARCYDSYLAEPQDAEPGFSRCVYVQTREGQLSWHIADSDLDLFEGMPKQDVANWDGHTTEEKYERLKDLFP